MYQRGFQEKLASIPVHMRPIVKALYKQSEKRNKGDNEILGKYFKEIKCFKDLNISKHDLLKLINCITV